MWASPVKARWGWKDWCESEQFHLDNLKHSFKFALKKDARVCHIDSVDDLRKLPRSNNNEDDRLYCIDFEKASKQYDAIELHLSDEPPHKFCEGLYFQLYGWDCDSILIMNPDIVEEVKK